MAGIVRDRELDGTMLRDSRRMIVRRDDLISAFSLSELFAEIGKRLQPFEEAGPPEASRWVLSRLIELRNLPEE